MLREKFAEGMTVKQYVSIMDADQKTLHETHYSRADLDEFREILSAGIFPPLKIIVLTEPWCGDSKAIVPVVLKLLEGFEQVDVRFLLRDSNPDLMDSYLTKGARSIPKIIIMNEEYRELAVWGSRPAAAQKIYEENRAKIESGEIEKSEVIKRIRNFYAKDNGKTIAEDFIRALAAAGRGGSA
jgi:hypothetical protein